MKTAKTLVSTLALAVTLLTTTIVVASKVATLVPLTEAQEASDGTGF